MDRNTGEVEVVACKTVVEQVTDDQLQISLESARAIRPHYQVGDLVEVEVTPRQFGRIAAQTAKQVVFSAFAKRKTVRFARSIPIRKARS